MGAFAQLVEKYQLLATSVALAASGVPAIAEELAQEAFVTAWYRLPELRELGKFRSWLCGIVRNHARTARRHARRHAPDAVGLVDDVVAEGPTPLDRAIACQEQSIVGDALAALPESYREPLVLFYVERLSIRDIADLLGISEETARQRLSRGRRKLRGDLAALAASRPVRAGVAASVIAAITASLPSPARAVAIGSAAAGKVGAAASTLLAVSLAAAVLAVIALGQRTSAAATRPVPASGLGHRASGSKSAAPAGADAVGAPRRAVVELGDAELAPVPATVPRAGTEPAPVRARHIVHGPATIIGRRHVAAPEPVDSLPGEAGPRLQPDLTLDDLL